MSESQAEEAAQPAAFEELSLEAQELVKDYAKALLEAEGKKYNARVAGAFYSFMISLLNAHASVASLRDELGLLNFEHKPQLLEVLVNSARHEANTADVVREEIIKRMQGTLLPFLLSEIRLEKIRDVEDGEETPMARKTIPLNMADIELQRDRTVLFVGSKEAVGHMLYMARQQIEICRDPYEVLLYFSTQTVNHNLIPKDGTKGRKTTRISWDRWIGEFNSRGLFERFVLPWRKQTYKNRVDSLIAGDIGLCDSEDLNDRLRTAHQAQRTIRHWATEHKVCVAAGFITTESLDAIGHHDLFQRLEVHTDLYYVTASPITQTEPNQPDMLLTIVSNKLAEPCEFTFYKEEIDE